MMESRQLTKLPIGMLRDFHHVPSMGVFHVSAKHFLFAAGQQPASGRLHGVRRVCRHAVVRVAI